MVNKSNKRKFKKGRDPAPPPPPPDPSPSSSAPVASSENDPVSTTPQKQYSSSVESSPLKVLVSSTKSNVENPTASSKVKENKPPASGQSSKVPLDDQVTSDKSQVVTAMEGFADNLFSSVTEPTGSINIDKLLDGTSKIMLFYPDGDKRNQMQGAVGGFGCADEDFILPHSLRDIEPMEIDEDQEPRREDRVRKRSDASATESADGDEATLHYELSSGATAQYIKLYQTPPPHRETDPFEMREMSSFARNVVAAAGIPYLGNEYPELPVADSDPPADLDFPFGLSNRDPNPKLYGRKGKSILDINPKLKIPPFPQSLRLNPEASGSRMQLEHTPLSFPDSLRADAPMQHRLFGKPGKCTATGCIKTATIACLACNSLLYCSDKHRKTAKHAHENGCVPYRLSESLAYGLHTIAFRAIPRNTVVLTEEPLLVLPLHPESTVDTNQLPQSYCVKCFRNSSDPDALVTCQKCELSICKSANECRLDFGYDGYLVRPYMKLVHDHLNHDIECKFLEKAYQQSNFPYFILPDQSVLGMLRCIPMLKNELLSRDIREFRELVNGVSVVKSKQGCRNFSTKLMLVRQGCNVDPKIISDDDLYRLDQALHRFGRNIGPETATIETASDFDSAYTRCVYKRLAHVVHSCVPNCILVAKNTLAVTMKSVKPLRKGDVITICYDERTLFQPTRDRRLLLERDFGFECRCKRCASPSELDTYFDSFPCPNRNRCKGKGFFVPVSPLNGKSDWQCNKCRGPRVSWLKMISITFSYRSELTEKIEKRDPLDLLSLMNEMVDENYVHWHHHLIFTASAHLFNLLFDALMNQDTRVLAAYSAHKGQQFLKPAETLFAISQVFMPERYATNLVLPLRLSLVVKLRHLTAQLSRRETTVANVEGDLNETCFRCFDMTSTPLYALELADKTAERCLNVMEHRVRAAFKTVLETQCKSGYAKLKDSSAIKFICGTLPNEFEIPTIGEKEAFECTFPDDIIV